MSSNRRGVSSPYALCLTVISLLFPLLLIYDLLVWLLLVVLNVENLEMADDKRLDVQGLRTVAIFAVLLFHFFPEYFPNGFLGVDIFFVISGFLITTILRKRDSYGCDTFLNFYFRRIKRILPLYLVFVCVAILLFTWNSNPSNMRDNQMTATMALLFSSNLYTLFQHDDYFQRVFSDSLFTHTWSLGLEVQFYLLAPFLFLFLSRLPSSATPYFMPVISLISLIFYVVAPSQISFNIMFARLWQFLATSITAGEEITKVPVAELGYEKLAQEESLLGDKERLVIDEDYSEDEQASPAESSGNAMRTFSYWISCIALFLPVVPLLTLEPTLARITVIIATTVIIQLGGEFTNRFLSSSPIVFLGDISYSCYLIHWPLAVYYTRTTDVLSYKRLLLIPSALLITVIVYFLFERYYRKWSDTVVKIFVGIFYVIAFGLILISPILNQHITDASISAIAPTIADAIKQNQEWFGHPGKYMTIPECTYTAFRNETRIVPPLGECTMPNGFGKLKFTVIGNSYAPNHADLIWKHFRPYFSTFMMFCQSSCEVFTWTHSGYCKHYVNFTDVLDDYEPDVVFITQRYGAPKNPAPKPGEPDRPLLEMLENMEKIKPKAHRFFIMDSFPAFDYYAFLGMGHMMMENKTAEEINSKICLRGEDATARPRTKKLVESCPLSYIRSVTIAPDQVTGKGRAFSGKYAGGRPAGCSHNCGQDKCRLYDVEPGLLDKEGRFCALDPNTSLALFEPGGHLTPWGRKNIEYIYVDLAKQYKQELLNLTKELYPGG